MPTKPYRFIMTLTDEERRRLTALRVASIDASGRMQSAAEVVRGLIREAAEARKGLKLDGGEA